MCPLHDIQNSRQLIIGLRLRRKLDLKAHMGCFAVFQIQSGELTSDPAFTSTLIFKLELLQITGTFKPRGALCVMLNMSSAERTRGVTAVSAGNHAIAVAYAARALGMGSKIVMIKTANPARVQLTMDYGAEIEFAPDAPSAFRRAPHTRIYGVEPTGADSMARSLVAGHPITLSSVSTIADSLAPPMATPYTFAVCREFVDRIALIDDHAMCETMAILFRDLKICVEPAGAAGLAAALGPLRTELQGGQRIGIVVCGSNIDLKTFCSQAASIE